MEIQSFRSIHSEIDKFNLSPDQSPDCSCVRLDPIGDLSKNNAGYRKFLLSSLYNSDNSGLTIHSQKTGGYYQHFAVDDGDSGRMVGIGDLVKSKVKQEDFNVYPQPVPDPVFTGDNIYSFGEYKGYLFAGGDNWVYFLINGTWVPNTIMINPPAPHDFVSTMYQGDLYVGYHNGMVYKYDGTAQTTSWAGLGGNHRIYGLKVLGSKLFALTTDSPVSFVYEYNGSAWSESYDPGAGGYFYTMAEYKDKLYIAGCSTGGSKVHYYDGSWQSLGVASPQVNSASSTVYKDKLYLGGIYIDGELYSWAEGDAAFTEVDSTANRRIQVNNLAVHQNKLWIGTYLADNSWLRVYDANDDATVTDYFNTGQDYIRAIYAFDDYLFVGTSSAGKIYQLK